ncbi:multicopper oxidase family protein [Paenibacillus sp. J5C_2022]|uniref:multicopper oxidase family protein n=1 Tax=Paenibacillus sp. J5C2022 TaxID=2977129 RepID=UPI0021CE4D9B|nr:multicopper oxidase family protein [Paenibacillus sp. J5C2022]MCU6707265.1 multicopper oxidase family protein [Paenibacillus sp. J5C2022]
MNNNKMKLAAAVTAFSIVLSACTNSAIEDVPAQSEAESSSGGNSTAESEKQKLQDSSIRNFALTAAPSRLDTGHGDVLDVWSYNGTVPGPPIEVVKGETVNITLQNRLEVPTSLHWHGVPVPNDMDGIPGVTQNAVQPGESFTYEFVADTPGTYWYHSHQDSVNQLDLGLYGTFVVKDPAEQYDRDYTIVLDEWMSSGTMALMDMAMSGVSEMLDDMPGMNHDNGHMNHQQDNDKMMDNNMHGEHDMQEHDMSMYDLYTMNGKSGYDIEPLRVKEGDTVRLRLINAGYLSHSLHLHGHDFKLITTDGQPLNNPAIVSDQLIHIAPGERYDIVFEADNPGEWYLEEHGPEERMANMRLKMIYENVSGSQDKSNWNDELPVLDLTKYGEASDMRFSLDQSYDVAYTMDLGTMTQEDGTTYTINDKVFPDTAPLSVKEGDQVLVTLRNTSAKDDHPMHLHGHFFQVLSKNGKAIEGSPIMKDTINLKPGEELVVAFEADNPGNWMFHCHDLHHASAGMVTKVQYSDFKSTFVNDPAAGNKPE